MSPLFKIRFQYMPLWGILASIYSQICLSNYSNKVQLKTSVFALKVLQRPARVLN